MKALQGFVRFSAGCALLGITYLACVLGSWLLAGLVGWH